MKKTLIILAAFLAALALIVSCSGEDTGTATIRFSITSDRARTLGGDGSKSEVSSYRFTLDHTSKSNVSYVKEENLSQDGTYTLSNILPGSYDITVEGISEEGKALVKYTGGHNIHRGAVSIPITFTTLEGSGSVSVTLRWDAAVFGGTNPTFEYAIYDEAYLAITNPTSQETEAHRITGVALDTSSISTGTAVISKSGLPSGSYFITVTVKKGSTIMYGATDVIRITPDAAVTGTFDFLTGGSAVQGFSLQNNTAAPLEGTLTAVRKDANNATLSVSLTKIPAGYSASDVRYRFYWEDLALGGEKTVSSVEAGLPYPGENRFSVIMYIPSLPGSMGSAVTVYTHQ